MSDNPCAELEQRYQALLEYVASADLLAPRQIVIETGLADKLMQEMRDRIAALELDNRMWKETCAARGEYIEELEKKLLASRGAAPETFDSDEWIKELTLSELRITLRRISDDRDHERQRAEAAEAKLALVPAYAYYYAEVASKGDEPDTFFEWLEGVSSYTGPFAGAPGVFDRDSEEQ